MLRWRIASPKSRILFLHLPYMILKGFLPRYIFLVFAFAVALPCIVSCSRHGAYQDHGEGMDEDVAARAAWETAMLADPATGKIPENIRTKELAFAATLPWQPEPASMKSGSFWQSRGPWNVGGRTRAIAVDVTNEHVILAGSVSGGIWRTEDDGTTWNKITGPTQDLGITCIVQNKRAGKTNIWYAGTGEYIGASASGGYALYVGDGVLKSTDGGKTWNKLASTSSGTPQAFDKAFDMIFSIAINEADTGDVVYVATGYSLGNVFKSSNGGSTWTAMKGAGLTTTCEYTEVAVSKTGVVYFTRSSDGSSKGFWRSPDGVNFTNIIPAGFAATYQRVVIGIDPNDENTVYFLGYTPGFGKKETDYRGVSDYGSLWKYQYISGNGTGTGGQWTDLTANLPAFGGDFGNFNTQTGYDLHIHVKPGDSKTIFIGSTNLWRSTDGFTSANNTTWVGGYGVNTARPAYKLYPNNHPDQHNLFFYPSNPNKMITSCDGGIFLCDDNTAASISYTPLNNGYITSQFYTVAIDHATPGNDELIGGLQDNGSFLTRSANQQDAWTMPGNGDGSYCAIVDGRTDYYVSSQQGHVYREQLGSNGLPNQWARMDPLGVKGQIFVDPFALDPNNQKRMYYVGTHYIWRNNDVTQIPLHSSFDTVAVTTGWQQLTTTKDSPNFITAIAVSTKPANRVMYGDGNGHVYRIDSASGSPIVKSVTSSLFPFGGYVSCVAMNPANADQVIVVFSNYSIISLFYSADGGKTFANISGNLEQNANGTGNGPSCRWASFMPMNSSSKTAYFIGTSVGLFSTDTLKGINTVWAHQDPNGIGNDIVTMMDVRRSDGLIAVATHGNGVYTANIQFSYQISGIDPNTTASNIPFPGLKYYPNPIASGGTMMLEFEDEHPGKLLVDILNEEGKQMAVTESLSYPGQGRQQLPIKLPALKPGLYYIRMQDGSKGTSRSFIIE